MNRRNSSNAGDPALEELAVAQSLGDDRVRHRVQQRDVRPRPDGEVTGGVVGQLDAPRIDDDQACAATGGLLDSRADDRMVLGRVRARTPGSCGRVSMSSKELVARPAPSMPLQRRGARRVADARAAVDVVGADDRARELLRQVVVLVRRAGRAEHADAVGAVAVDQLRAAGRRRTRAPRSRTRAASGRRRESSAR